MKAGGTIFPLVIESRQTIENVLINDGLVIVRNGVVCAMSGRLDPLDKWRYILEIMAGDLPPEEKLARLKALGFIESVMDLKQANGFYPVTYFKPTSQLWKRLDGDASWTNEASGMLSTLTNGWQMIQPEFMRDPDLSGQGGVVEQKQQIFGQVHSQAHSRVTAAAADEPSMEQSDCHPIEGGRVCLKWRQYILGMPIGLIIMVVALIIFFISWRVVRGH